MKAIITGVGHYVPERRLTNFDLEKTVNTSDEWITTRTGIQERRILDDGKGTSYMAVKAARMLLEQRQISAAEIDLIIVATVTPDMVVPATAALVQDALQASNSWGFDLNGGCTGFVCALATASQFIETGKHRKILVIGADKMSSILDYEDRNTCVLFGDAAGAVLVEPSREEDAGIEDFMLRLDGSGQKHLHVKAGGSLQPATRATVDKKWHTVYQDGRAVFKHAVKRMADISVEILKKNRLNGKHIKLFIPHQANLRIIDAVAQKMELEPDKIMININRYGNTTAATIPLAMSEAYQNNRLQKGDWVVISAFGAGFTWGSMLLRWAMN